MSKIIEKNARQDKKNSPANSPLAKLNKSKSPQNEGKKPNVGSKTKTASSQKSDLRKKS
jgi:hypothetical protein